MSRKRAVKVSAILKAIQSAGVAYRKVYIFEKEVQIVCLDGLQAYTMLFRL